MLRELDDLPRNRGYEPRYSHRTNAGKSSVKVKYNPKGEFSGNSENEAK